MRVLISTGHPAQAHNFRKVRDLLINDGHEVFWLTTKKDICTQLLDIYGISYSLLRKPGKGMWNRMWTILVNIWYSLCFIRANKIDIVVNRLDPYTTIAAKLVGCACVSLNDTENAVPMERKWAWAASSIVVADSFRETLSSHQMCYPANIELFYCHPNRFHYQEPWSLLGIEPATKFAIVRFVKWDAYHDTKLVGGFTLDQKRELVNRLAAHMRVFISSETELPADLEPYRIRIPIERMHDVQAAASLFVGESATMASESVVLGTPAVYIDEVGRGYTDEEAREKLLYMFRPVPNKAALKPEEKDWILGGVEECIATAEAVASPAFDQEAWRLRHEAWMQTKIDPTAWLTWLIENYPLSAEEYRTNRAEIEKRFR